MTQTNEKPKWKQNREKAIEVMGFKEKFAGMSENKYQTIKLLLIEGYRSLNKGQTEERKLLAQDIGELELKKISELWDGTHDKKTD